MFSRSARLASLLVFLAATALSSFAQNHPAQSRRGYKRPGISRGSPVRPLTGPAAGRPADLAAHYLREHGSEADLVPEDVAEAAVTSETKGRHNGITHVFMRQRVDGREVAGADSNINVGRDGAVLSFGTTFLPEVRQSINLSVPEVDALSAVSAAIASVGLSPTEPLQTLEVRQGPEQETLFSGGGIANGRIAAKLVYQPVDLRDVRLAWQVDIDERSGDHLWQITVDAATGEVLHHEDFVNEDNWDLPSRDAANRAAAATQKKPLNTIIALSSPTPVHDSSKYRVFAMPKESPNDGPQSLVENPADATASPHGWHDTNQTPGAEFTMTRGNNVHAYLDQDNNGAPDAGFDVDGGPGLSFDFFANLAEHAQNYREAVVSNLFYWNNLFHDVLYRYGFDEVSGNFQANNYMRGGLEGDYVRAEAADGGGANNANFATPTEPNSTGAVPRMQMYLWPGDQFGPANQVVVEGVGSFDASWARFSPAPTVAGTAGQIINAGNGCSAADYAAPPTDNWIAIVTGNNSGCQNIEKARQAGAAGAKALIVANTSSSSPVLSGSVTSPVPAIPVASINLAAGTTIRDAIASAPVVTGTVRKHPNHPGIRDGDFENGIVLHEYGHGVSIRLTGGPAVNCLSGDEQGGEGWSDYFAMIMTIDPAIDSGDGARGMGPYALFQPNREGSGIRPRRYSRNMETQPFTYDSIKSGGWLNGGTLSAPHGIGHGWASLLWDMTWDLIDKHGFNPDLYGPWNSGGNNRALQYVIDGLKMQGCSPGFVAARNAIIAAAEALDPGDACTLWASFARRGLGYSAVQGGTSRSDNTEAFDTAPACRAGFGGRTASSPAINVTNVGSTIPLTFSYPGAQGNAVLAKNSPYSRQVECTTLRTLDPNAQFITPRPYPVPMQSPGNAGLQYNQGSGQHTFTWQTDPAWAGTCREAVFTRKDGVQHRAYFFFDSAPSFPVSGHVRDSSGQPVPGATVKIAGSAYGAVVTDGSGFFHFPAVARGTYSATATPAGTGCVLGQTVEFSVSRPTTLDFTLGTRVDVFGYSCRNESAAFDEAAASIVPVTGTSGVATIDLPFPFTFYGQTYERLNVCANGFVEFASESTTNCSSFNGSIPGTGRPNGAIYPFWDDLAVDGLASIRSELKGTAPNRRFVVEFRNVHVAGNTSQRLDFNAILNENGHVVMQHRNIADDIRERGSSATIGIDMHTGTVALMYSRNAPVLAVEPAVTTIRYIPPRLYTVTGRVNDTDGGPAENVTVTLATTAFTLTATTDAAGLYAFPGVPAGTYTATAAAGRCKGHAQALVVSVDTTLDFTLGDMPDAFGYRCSLEDTPFEEAANVQPITGTTTSGVATVDLPFPFTLYGETYNRVYVCANGFVEFAGPTTTNCSSVNGTIPGSSRPNGAIYPFWDDLVVDALASIRTELKGSAPNRSFVIEFRNVHITSQTTQRLDFNAVLLEDGQILTQYRNIGAVDRERGNSATLGIENASGTVALMYSRNQVILPLEPAVTTIRYVPPPLATVSGQVRDGSGAGAPGVTVTLERSPLVLTTTTDSAGFYTLRAPHGAYTANAKAGGCSGQTQAATISGDTVLNFTLGDVTDEFGYRCRLESRLFEEADTILPITGDDLEPVAGSIEIPFPFTFYGQTYTDAYVCTNGFLEFAGPSTSNCAVTNTAIPNTDRPNGVIYALWDDVFVDSTASIRTELKGVTPNRMFVVEFRNVRFLTTQRLDFNIVLHEDGRAMTQYRNVSDNVRERGSSATIGIEDHTGEIGLEFSLNESVLPVEPAVTTIMFRPPGTP